MTQRTIMPSDIGGQAAESRQLATFLTSERRWEIMFEFIGRQKREIADLAGYSDAIVKKLKEGSQGPARDDFIELFYRLGIIVRGATLYVNPYAMPDWHSKIEAIRISLIDKVNKEMIKENAQLR